MNIADPSPAVPAFAWFKSSYSSGEGGQCVEIARVPDAVLVRDSKQDAGPVLAVPAAGWADFVSFVAA
ncbi:DUF397 domain-containing protein [Streptomyces niveus]|uniref:DUF397 domain-containing protein n=1 Tax=Streptomyces niveus TaxID=193462 RepID=UPI0036D364E5